MKDFDILIEPEKSIKNFWKELYAYRELFLFLAWRDILVRYKQTVIGIAWSILRPLLTMVVFTIVFGKLAKMPSGGIPYPILVFSAMLPWQFFSNIISESGNSLISNSNMISKVYFPRIIIPTTSMIVSLIDFFISSFIFVLIMLFYKFIPTIYVLLIPFLLIHAIITSLGIGYLVSALSVKYRDFRYIIPFMVQFGLYISPVGFSSSVIPEKWRLIYSLNPMVGIIDGFRWEIIGDKFQIYVPGFILSIGISISIFIVGFVYFRKTEREFADVI